MALVILTTQATDEGDFPLKITLTDSITGDPVTPNSDACTWSLYSENGTVVNSRSDVDITSASTMYFALSGNDLDYAHGEWRVFELKGAYDSTSFGSNISFNVAIKFQITKTV